MVTAPCTSHVTSINVDRNRAQAKVITESWDFTTQALASLLPEKPLWVVENSSGHVYHPGLCTTQNYRRGKGSTQKFPVLVEFCGRYMLYNLS